MVLTWAEANLGSGCVGKVAFMPPRRLKRNTIIWHQRNIVRRPLPWVSKCWDLSWRRRGRAGRLAPLTAREHVLFTRPVARHVTRASACRMICHCHVHVTSLSSRHVRLIRIMFPDSFLVGSFYWSALLSSNYTGTNYTSSYFAIAIRT